MTTTETKILMSTFELIRFYLAGILMGMSLIGFIISIMMVNVNLFTISTLDFILAFLLIPKLKSYRVPVKQSSILIFQEENEAQDDE